MTYDIIIKGGTIVDGTGAPRFAAAVTSGTITMKDATCPALHAALQAAEKLQAEHGMFSYCTSKGALLNLARNGAEACAEAGGKGRVTVRGEIVRTGESGFQRVTILDNGPGIADAAMPNLFHPFFTTKPNGTGLGLAVVQKIIVQHGGQVEARNRPEGGAAFILTLPEWRSSPEAVELRKDVVET